MENITLYFRQGSSDKVYQTAIEPKDDGHIVTFAYGRRGSTLATGTKTTAPVPYEDAKRIYDKLVAEKSAKGYTLGESGTPYQHTERETQFSGITPQLLNPVVPDEAAQLATNSDWCVQEKFDGRRMLVRKYADGIDGINRKGLIVALPEPVARAVAQLPGTFVFDGECVGNTLIVFDVLELDGSDCRARPYRDRLFALMQSVPEDGSHLRSPETAMDTSHKVEFIQRMRQENKEGVVLKRLTGTYLPGRPSSGGDALKLKFVESASFVIAKVNAKRSVSLQLLSGAKWVDAGNVTIPPNQEIPAKGTVAEVKYLYAFPESGCVYQPVYLGQREDIAAAECVVGQLKYKAAAEAA